MKIRILSCAAALVLGLTPALQAQSVSATQPQTVRDVLRASGLPAELGTDPAGNPAIIARLDGTDFNVLFYGCTAGAACQDLQLRIAFTVDALTQDTITTWNQSTYLGKAYIAPDGAAVLEHAVAGADGLSRFAVQRLLVRWKVAVDGYKQAIGVQP